MQQNLQNNQEKEVWTDLMLFKKIYIRPREAFRYIKDNDYNKYQLISLLLVGISMPFYTLMYQLLMLKFFGISGNLRDTKEVVFIVWIVFGVIMLFQYANAFEFIGKRFGGTANADNISSVIAYSLVPLFLNILIFLLQNYIIGAYQLENSLSGDVVLFGMFGLQIGIVVWANIVFMIGISEVQKISVFFAFLNFVCTNIFVRIVVWIVGLTIYFIFWLANSATN